MTSDEELRHPDAEDADCDEAGRYSDQNPDSDNGAPSAPDDDPLEIDTADDDEPDHWPAGSTESLQSLIDNLVAKNAPRVNITMPQSVRLGWYQQWMSALKPLGLVQETWAKQAMKSMAPVLEQQNQVSRRLLESIAPFQDQQSLWAEQLAATVQATLGDSLDLTFKNYLRAVNFGLEESTIPAAVDLATRWAAHDDRFVESTSTLDDWAPENLHGLPVDVLDRLRDLVLEDSIAVYGAPRLSIIKKLVNAPDKGARRTILDLHADDILRDCRDLVGQCSSEEAAPVLPFIYDALDAFEAGHETAAQALAASVIEDRTKKLFDSILGAKRTKYSASEDSARITRSTEQLDALSDREYLAVAPVWRIYQSFRVENGDPIPEAFNRNAVAHMVSRQQYTRINTVQGLLFACTFLWFFDEKVLEAQSREVEAKDAA